MSKRIQEPGTPAMQEAMEADSPSLRVKDGGDVGAQLIAPVNVHQRPG